MNVDQEQKLFLRKLALALLGVIKGAREVPSGHLYAAVMDKVDLETYQGLLRILEDLGLISVDASHLIRYTGLEA